MDRVAWTGARETVHSDGRTQIVIRARLVWWEGSSKVKVKDSRNRPGVAPRVPGGLGSQIFMTFGT